LTDCPTARSDVAASFTRGQRVIYTQLCRPVNIERLAMVLREQFVGSHARRMYVIRLEGTGYIRQVSPRSLRALAGST
jgi:hypothetical protein